MRLNPLGFNTTNVTNTTASYYLEMYTEDPTDLQVCCRTPINGAKASSHQLAQHAQLLQNKLVSLGTRQSC